MEATKLLISIVERGKGVTMQRLYTQYQIFLHLQCSGRGTATSEIMDILGLGSSEKDVVLSFATAPSAQRLLHDLDNDLRGNIESSGIVFDLPISGLNNLAAALVDFKAEQFKRGNGGDSQMEHTGDTVLILVACSLGHADAVMTTAKANGARGGTVIKGRMAGLEDLEQAYSLILKAEREVVAIVVSKEKRASIMEAVNAAHGLRSETQGVVCSVPIDHVVRLG